MSAVPNRWGVLLLVSAGLLLVTLDNSILYTALPTLTRELDAGSSAMLWIVNAYPLVMAGLLPGAGTLGDRFGHRWLFLAGLAIFGLASLLAAFAPSAAMLIGARALLAVGAAAMMPATLSLIRISFADERERHLAIAVWGSLAIVGAALGPVIGGLLLSHFWWGSVFLINVPVVVLTFVAGWLIAPSNPVDEGRAVAPWDGWSSVLALVTLAGLVLAIKQAAHAAQDMVQGAAGSGQALVLPLVALAAALVAGVLFARRQARLAHPLIDFALFRNPAFLAGVLAAGFVLFALAGLQLIITQRFQLVDGMSPMHAGLLVSAIAVGALPTALLGGALLHRLGLPLLMSGGMALAAGAVVLAALVMAQPDAPLAWLVATLCLAGAGIGATISVASSAIMNHAPVHRAGMAASVEEVSYELGGLAAVALLGSLLPALYSIGLQLPPGAPEAARGGIVAALELAGSAADGAALRMAAATAFDAAFLKVLWLIAAMLATGALVTARLLRRNAPVAAPDTTQESAIACEQA
ncbi:MFS transporter [Altererythrobacter xixiisoli]|uniref:MFS transporter n=1 Tax=Croceibacterium xixiisoli TaxID=1476466 RepID=A0A6I4TVP3_9SPHN|nr:MFS transporter [Croceibacterium xixiisoli]MXO99320.1 MFS transporter [Croceibacterium xixiisoli]